MASKLKPYLDCITAVARRYVADIFAALRKYEYNPDLMRLYIVGGGAKNAYLNELTEQETGLRVVALPIEATALGNLKIQMTREENI